VTVLGLLAGAAFAHNFGLAASPKGVPVAGQTAVLIGFAAVFIIGFFVIKANQSVQGVKANAGSKGRQGASVS
jgi:hypothetical protein